MNYLISRCLKSVFFTFLYSCAISAQYNTFDLPVIIKEGINKVDFSNISEFQQNKENLEVATIHLVFENGFPKGVRLYLVCTDRTVPILPFHEAADTEQVQTSELIDIDPKSLSQLYIVANNSSDGTTNIASQIRVFLASKSIGSKPQIIPSLDLEDCECPLPPYISRSVWGSNFDLNENIFRPPATYTNVTHLIVHHSAGTNISNNWAAVVAAIFDYHVNGNGWQDVGYNWLIDPNGILYEGRGGGEDVRGAHMCGYNNNTMGVCILGNFNLINASDAAVEKLEQLLAWKACKEKLNPLGSADIYSHPGHMKHISGHKDGCQPGYTECPGNLFYPVLANIRANVDYQINTECSEIVNTSNSNNIILKIFPNPTSDIIQFESEAKNKWNIVNILGQQILELYNQDQNWTIDATSWPSGIYFISCVKTGQVFKFAKN